MKPSLASPVTWPEIAFIGAVAALLALGFKSVDAEKGVRTALIKLGAGVSADQLVKAALGR